MGIAHYQLAAKADGDDEKTKHLLEAQKAFKKAKSLENNEELWESIVENLAAISLNLKDYDTAIENYEDLIEKNGPDADTYNLLSGCYSKKGNKKKAEEYFRKAQKLED